MKGNFLAKISEKGKGLLGVMLLTSMLGQGHSALAQTQGVRIGATAAAPDQSAMLDIAASDKGLLIPRLTESQRKSIAAPTTGLMVFQTDGSVGFWYYVITGGWTFLNPAGDGLGNHTATQNLNLSDKVLVGQTNSEAAVSTDGVRVDSDGKVSIGPKRPSASTYAGLEENTGSGILSTGTLNPDNYDQGTIAGSGIRMHWDPEKAAFRAGEVTGTQWDRPNVGYHSVAMGYNVRANGQYATALGFNNVTSNTGSVAAGMYCTASGYASVALGYYANTSARLGSFVFSDRSVFDDGNINTDESFRAAANNTFNARFINGYYLYTNISLTTGVKVSPGGNAWETVSDSTKKERIKLADGDEFLSKISRMRLGSWNYKGQSADSMRHYGPMAQEFHAAFGNDGVGTIGSSTTINQADFDGINLIAIQALEKRTAELQRENKLLKEQLSELVQDKPKTAAALKKENKLMKSRFGQLESEMTQIKALLQGKQNQAVQAAQPLAAPGKVTALK